MVLCAFHARDGPPRLTSHVNFIGDRLELSLGVLSYQFPDSIDYWDGNWLVIDGSVIHPSGPWNFREACLTSFELQQLAEWFDGVERGHPDRDGGYFTEPCLGFSYVASPDPAIAVLLAHECAPPWITDHDDRLGGIRLHFPLSANQPRLLAAAVRDLLVQFPVRYAA